MFVRNGIEANLYQNLNNLSCKEAYLCEVKVNKHEKLFIGVVYRLPNSSGENNQKWNEMLSSIVNERHARIIVMGDFNYTNINWDTWIANASS